MFEDTLAEVYDDELLGELKEYDSETRGKDTLEGCLLFAVVEGFIMVQRELADAEGKLRKCIALRQLTTLSRY